MAKIISPTILQDRVTASPSLTIKLFTCSIILGGFSPPVGLAAAACCSMATKTGFLPVSKKWGGGNQKTAFSQNVKLNLRSTVNLHLVSVHPTELMALQE